VLEAENQKPNWPFASCFLLQGESCKGGVKSPRFSGTQGGWGEVTKLPGGQRKPEVVFQCSAAQKEKGPTPSEVELLMLKNCVRSIGWGNGDLRSCSELEVQ